MAAPVEPKQREAAIGALAAFLSDSQAHLSILAEMGQVKLHKAWCAMRNELGLRGWHTKEEAEEAIRRVLCGVAKPKTVSVFCLKRGRGVEHCVLEKGHNGGCEGPAKKKRKGKAGYGPDNPDPNWVNNPCPLCGRLQSCDHTLEQRGGR